MAGKSEPFGGKRAAPFGKGGRQEPGKTDRDKRAAGAKKATPKKTSRGK
jgi:hypothetical protein